MNRDNPNPRKEVKTIPTLLDGKQSFKSLARQETIQLKDSDWIGIREGLYLVNFKISYNPRYYTIKPSNGTQKGVIQRLQPQPPKQKRDTPKTTDLDTELNQLLTIDRLKKSLLRHFNSIDRLRCLSGDDALLKRRRINKAKTTIKKYLNSLREDTNFKIETLEKQIKLCYSGKYVTALKVVVL